MIARHLPIKNNYKSSAQGLVSYLMNTQENSHRVLDFSITNCLGITSDDEEAITAEEVHLAAREMIAVQCMNSSAKSAKMYHLLVSFKDDPDKATLHNIEQELCEALGFKDFQRVSVLHGDTDNAHLHIAINKIHPATYNIHNPYRDHTVLAHMCEKLEKKYGIQVECWYPLGHADDRLLNNEVLSAIAQAHDKSVVQIILRWHMQEGLVAVPGSTSPAHIQENIAIFDFELTDAEMEQIRAMDRGEAGRYFNINYQWMGSFFTTLNE